MKKKLALILSLALLFFMLVPAVPADAETQSSFVLTAANANSIIIEPVYIPYTSGQSVKEALLASDHSFVGLEQGFIYEVDGITANFIRFYDEGGYDLDVPAEDISALCIGVSSQYSEELLELILRMAEYRNMGNVQHYPAAQDAYNLGLAAIRNGDGATSQAVLEQLNQAISDYEAIFQGDKYTLTISAMQGSTILTAPVVKLTDIYGNETVVTGTSMQVIAGEYNFSISDGSYNRTEGTVTVAENTSLTTVLPDGEWFGATKILDGDKEAYPYVQNIETHMAVYQVPDIARKVGDLYLNIEQGAVPNVDTTKLRTIYTGLNGIDYSDTARSWESTETALTHLVKQGMEGANFRLEAQYFDDNAHTQIQSYDMLIERSPTLASLVVTGDGTILPVAYDPVTYSYEITTVSDSLDIEAEPFGADYTVTGEGTITSGESHTVTVSANDKSSSYTLNITKKDSVPVTLTTPEDVSVQVENSAGSVIVPISGIYHLIPGESYAYRATKNIHYHTASTFTALDGLNVNVAAPIAIDWLDDLALYDSGSIQNRIQYPCDSDFTSADHGYVYEVSDHNTTVYIQASSNYAMTANYLTQSTYAGTHGVQRSVSITRQVNPNGSAQILTRAVDRSGYSNAVILRISDTSGDIQYYQDYTLTLARKLHLTDMAITGVEGELPLLDSAGDICNFDRDITNYRIDVNRDETVLYFTGTFPNVLDMTDCCGGYYALVNGTRYDTLENIEISLNTELDTETLTVQICHAEDIAVPTQYSFAIKKTDPVAITFQTTPDDAIVYLTNDLNGKHVLGNGGVYLLTPGGNYSYTITCAGYRGISGSYTVPAADAIETFALTEAAPNTSLQQLSSYWPHLRRNNENNGVIDSPTPIQDDEAVLYWATKIGDGYDKNACGCPILVDGYLYTYSGSTIYKVDTVTGAIVKTGTMDCSSSFAINPPTYADGMLFIGLAGGTVQAFNAATLESLWIYRDPLGGQPNCSIVYHDGYVYTGFWIGETSQANYVCLSATDEDPNNVKEEKLATWRYSSPGGFYWAGAYVCDDYLLIGTDDGASGYTSGKARLLSFNSRTGELLDEWKMGVPGDIRSSITAYNGKYYFTNKGGYFFEASISGSGEIENIRTLKLYNYSSDSSAPAMSTCTPTIYNGRAYVGASGTSQFGAYSGHNITVIDIPNWEIAYTVRTQGYPQTSGVLTTAYQAETGNVYVYFFDNYTPGKLRVLQDKPGQTSASLISVETYMDKGTVKTYETAYALFTPNGDQAQYALCSPIMDECGTIYFKNDSAYLMAVGSTIENLEITQEPEKMTYQEGEVFNSTGMQVIAHYSNGTSQDVTEYITWSEEPLTTADSDFVITFPYVMYQNQNGTAGVDYPEPMVVLTLTIGKDIVYGDLNGDGSVNVQDVLLALRYINGLTQFSADQILAADVSGDGVVNTVDITLMLEYINGTITVFPVQSEE